MWYKQSQFGAGYGEHWIDEDGNLMYADGDIGDMNHEAYVIQRARGEIAGDQWNQGEFVNWEAFQESVASQILQEAKTNPNLQEEIESEIGDIYTTQPRELIGYDYIDNELLRRGINAELLNVAQERANARMFGMKTWGWKRVMNNYVETFVLTNEDCQVIAKGLGELVPDDEDGNSTWNIEIVSNRQYFQSIPLSIIEKGTQAIFSYSRQVKSSVWYRNIII